MKIMDSLRELLLLPAPSGYENAVAQRMAERFSPYADTVFFDRAGNVIARFTGKRTDLPSVMVYAHMDQIGFIIRQITEDGYLRLERLGGVPEKVLPALRLRFFTDDGRWVPGVMGSKSHHVTPAEEKYHADPIGSLYADVGATSAQEVFAMGLGVGNPGIYEPSFSELGGVCFGTSVDNRGGCVALLRLAELLGKQRPEQEVFLVGTVQEEFNLRGAMLAARVLKPDIAIALDVALAGDTPDLSGRFPVKLGGGPVVSLYNFHGRGTLNGTIAHRGLADLAIRAAKEADIPLQRFASAGILTDSAYVQLENEGIAALDLGFPARYTHTPVEACNPEDIEQLARLIREMLGGMDETFRLPRY